MNRIEDIRFNVSSSVSTHDIDNGVFIFHTKSEVCYGLEGISLEIWTMLSSGQTINEVVKTVQKNYDIDKEMVSEDIKKFVNQLIQNELLQQPD